MTAKHRLIREDRDNYLSSFVMGNGTKPLNKKNGSSNMRCRAQDNRKNTPTLLLSYHKHLRINRQFAHGKIVGKYLIKNIPK